MVNPAGPKVRPMTRKYFGTDGIRGRTNASVLTPEIAMKAGMAAGRIFTRGDHRHRVVIGKDTRLSGYMIESALISGFTAVGMDVFQFGPLPTPAVAMLTRSLRADLGVMITASHNPYADTMQTDRILLAAGFQQLQRCPAGRKEIFGMHFDKIQCRQQLEQLLIMRLAPANPDHRQEIVPALSRRSATIGHASSSARLTPASISSSAMLGWPANLAA